MQILVESLRRTESSGIGQSEVDVLRRVVAQVHSRTENHVVDKVMLVESAAEQEAPLLVLPFVLEVEAPDIGVLLEVAVVAQDNILQPVVVILRSEGEVGRHEQKLAE